MPAEYLLLLWNLFIAANSIMASRLCPEGDVVEKFNYDIQHVPVLNILIKLKKRGIF
jgi:hypothetical protein